MSNLYRFKRDDAARFAKAQNIRTKISGDEMQFRECPYCHSTKDAYSFAINMQTGQFKCLRASCGAHGNMLTLHRDFNFDLGTDVSEYERPAYSWRRFKTPEAPIEPTEPAIAYLTGRGIPEDVIRRYEIKTKTGQDNVLAFPFFNQDGDLEFIKYRKTDFDKTKDQNKEWCEKNCRAILFGMKQCTSFDRLIITEGQIDSLSVAAAGFENAVSVPNGKNGMTWIPHCWDWLKQFNEIIVFGDYEHGEITLLNDIRARFDCKVSSVRPVDYRGCKDANELLKRYGAEAVRIAINNAVPELPEAVRQFSAISYNNEEEKDILPTGITELDKLLKGGLRFGYMHIMTGKRGEGKSTMASMLVKSALDMGLNVFVYSGEMTPGDVKCWLDYQIAGAERVICETVNGYERYRLSNSNIDTINAWYTDRAYIYDTSAILDDRPDFLQIIIKQITQVGCRFILIDNLMTAIDLIDYSGTKFEKQEYFCKRLAEIATRYKVMIILVAHKKKEQRDGKGDENDDVLGSSEITNLSGLIMSYSRSNKCAENQRVLKLTKNRVDGRCNFEGWVVNYHPASKRIYGEYDTESTYDSTCWKDEDTFVPVMDTEEIPY